MFHNAFPGWNAGTQSSATKWWLNWTKVKCAWLTSGQDRSCHRQRYALQTSYWTPLDRVGLAQFRLLSTVRIIGIRLHDTQLCNHTSVGWEAAKKRAKMTCQCTDGRAWISNSMIHWAANHLCGVKNRRLFNSQCVRPTQVKFEATNPHCSHLWIGEIIDRLTLATVPMS